MNRRIFDDYGETMLESFCRFWPHGDILVYTEDGALPFKHDRVQYRLLYEIPGLAYFLEGVLHFPIFSGRVGEAINYRFNINAYGRKAFAQMAAASEYRGYLYWIDADVATIKHIPAAMIEGFLAGQFMAVMRRKTWHLCTSFVGWDCGHAFAPDWWKHYQNVYQTGAVFLLNQWDDCTILEHTIQSLVGIKDIAEHVTGEGPYNVFDEVFKGYAMHDKGPAKFQNRYGHLIEIVGQTRPARIIEIGTWNGGRAIEMHKASPESEYIGFDLFEDATAVTDAAEKNVKKHHSLHAVTSRLDEAGVKHTLYKGDSKEKFAEYLNEHGEHSADLIFIDGGHSVETIRVDLGNAKKAIKPGGLIIMDDFYTEMPESELQAFGAQAVLNGSQYVLLPIRDHVRGGGRVQMAAIEC